MKTFTVAVFAFVFSLQLTQAEDLNQKDKKWGNVVLNLADNGKSDFATSNKARAEYIKALGPKMGWDVRVKRVRTGFEVNVTKAVAKAKSSQDSKKA